MFGYPAEYGKPGTPFSKFVRWNVEHRAYGPGDVEEMVVLRVGLARRMEPHRLQRIRPNGRVIEVLGTPVPCVGFVTSSSDLTALRRETRRSYFTSTLSHSAYTPLAAVSLTK